ncbi:hypothetical protein MCOR27_007222 [Pyricularia oryzae]|nr:hypothetical protein MCOR27_007222 [Pyricularia oryzae]KAI6428742.1 hypothetical protein MCOR21_005388 [Pyricularia oryzae]KAI6446721.1 hypothetical protein MCOR22_003671 [Pyricularia oryzae]KAI6624750.1 hypothetical protein MCOR07_003249 [Pyricularia oryzae]
MFISNYIVDETVNRSLLKHGSRVITVGTGSVTSERSLNTCLLSSQRTRYISLENITDLEALKSRVGEEFGVVQPSEITFHAGDGTQLHCLGDVSRCRSTIDIRIAKIPIHSPLACSRDELYPNLFGNVDRLCARYGAKVIKTDNMGMVAYYSNDPVIARHVLQEGGFFSKRTPDPGDPLHFVSDSEALFGDGDSPAFGPSHHFIPPCVGPKAVRYCTPSVQRSVEKAFYILDAMSDGSLAFNVYQYMFILAGQIVWKTVFGADLGHFNSIEAKSYKTIHHLSEYLALKQRLSLRPPWYANLPFGDPRRMREVRHLLWAGVDEAIEQCCTDACTDEKESPLYKGALHTNCLAADLQKAVDGKGNRLPREHLVNNCVVLFGAGFVTLSTLLSWCVYALCRYNSVQDRLLKELLDHGVTEDKAWTMDELNDMPYLDWFVKETQRIYSPSLQTARVAQRDVVLPGGVMISEGSVVIPTLSHQDSVNRDSPVRFDPESWENKAARTLPQSRGCAGFSRTLLEVKMAMALLVYRYEFSHATVEPVVYDAELLAVRPVNFYARTKRRTCWPGPSPKKEDSF